MKILITKDEHLSLGFRSKFRKPGWEKDVFNKHLFIIEYMKKNNIKYKITTGDIFDKQRQWSFKQFLANKKILELYKENNLEILSIAGNHDMIDGRLDISESPFEEMVKQDLITYISIESFVFKEEGLPIAEVHGIDYRYINDLYTKEDFFNEIRSLYYKTDNVDKILVIHQNVTPYKERVTEFTYDELSQVCNEKKIKYLICGHYHIGYPTETINGVTIINPWNLWRVVRDYSTRENEHTPEIVELDLTTGEINHIIVPHLKYEEAFDLKEIDFNKELKKDTFSFFSNLKTDNDLLASSEKSDKDLLNDILINLRQDKDNSILNELTEDDLNEILEIIKNKLGF